MCEEFPAYTIETAEQALDERPDQVAAILEMRGFVRAKDHIEHAKDWNDLKLTDSVKQYMKIEAEVMQDAFKRKAE